jgi:hypothetical protein
MTNVPSNKLGTFQKTPYTYPSKLFYFLSLEKSGLQKSGDASYFQLYVDKKLFFFRRRPLKSPVPSFYDRFGFKQLLFRKRSMRIGNQLFKKN